MHWSTLCLIGVLVSLPSCGGGSSGGGLAEGTAEITAQNAQAIACLAIGGCGNFERVSNVLEDISAEFDLTQPGTYPCNGLLPGTAGGSLTLKSVDLSPVNELSAGDSATLTFDSCVIDVDGEQERIIGTMSSVVDSVSDSALSITFTVRDLTVTGGGETATVNGDITLDARKSGVTALTVISRGHALTIQNGHDAELTSLEDYRFERTADIFTGEFTSTQSGTIRHPALDGAVTFRTTSRFEGMLPGHAERGQLQIDGANGSVLVLTILDAVNIQGEVDEDGDGVFDATFLTTWDALFS